MAMFTGKSACVTGGGSGIGRGAALAFAREGAAVVVVDVAAAAGQETVAMITREGGDAIFHQADVTKSQEVAGMVRLAVQRRGRLDCAFNNAGIGVAALSTGDYSEAQFDDVIGVNLKGVFLCMKHELT